MASLGSALINKVFGHSEAEDAFRPWWDSLEDFLIYGLVMLGLLVVPTAMVMKTPLECTFCKDDLCQDINITNNHANDPEYFEDWIKEFCTFNGSVDPFILYFPYIFLLVALVMVLMEKVFIAVFRSHHKLDRFYKLLLDQNVIKTGEVKYTNTRAREVIEIEESFKSYENNYFMSYLVRTILELLVVLTLLAGIILYGIPVIFSEDHIIPCQINNYWYVCSGHPQEFYRFILIIAIIIILLYIFTNIYNLVWIFKPFDNKIGTILSNYRENLEISNNLCKDNRLKSVYFENKDLKMLIDLLALNLGVGPALQVISIFDKDFYHAMSSRIVKIKLHPDCKSVQLIIQKPTDLFCSSCQGLPGMRVKMVVELCSAEENPAMVFDVLDDTSAVTATFRSLSEELDYSLKVSILVNGKIVSSVSKDLNDVERSDTKLATESWFFDELSTENEQLQDTTPLLIV